MISVDSGVTIENAKQQIINNNNNNNAQNHKIPTLNNMVDTSTPTQYQICHLQTNGNLNASMNENDLSLSSMCSSLNNSTTSSNSSNNSATNTNNLQQQNNMLNSTCSNGSGTNSSNSLSDNDAYNDYTSKTNLIVNYLPQNMTQDEIKSLFSSIGAVETCKLVKEKLSASNYNEGQSLGYAFVNFLKPEDATKAINLLNGMRLQNKTIKVSFARPSSETIKGANLYICGLKLEVTQAELEGMFQPFGTIISSKILTDPKTGTSKGVGFVRFDQRSEAEFAIEKLNGSVPQGYQEPIIVKFANSPATAKSVMGLPLAPFVPTCRGFFQPYRSSTNSSYRYSPISTYCPDPTTIIQQHQPPTNPTTIATPATITLPNIIAATPLTTTIPATTPTPSISNSSLNTTAGFSGWCIFVYNLGPETDENILWQLFGPFGAVQSVKIIRDIQSQKCKGFGFVTMTNYDEAILAINYLNGINLGDRILQVSFKTNSNKQFF